MGGILGALQMSLRTLSNMQTGLQVVSENVSNVNTEGYSRKRVVFTSTEPDVQTFGVMGTGAIVQRVMAIRDSYLESRIQTELQTFGYHEGRQTSLSQLQTLISGSEGANVSEQLSRFLDSFLELAGDPSSVPLRESVLAEAQQLTWTFQNSAAQVNLMEQGTRTRIRDTVDTINNLLTELGDVNSKLTPILQRGLDGGSLFDQRQLILNELNSLANIQVTLDASNNMIVSTQQGSLLLVGSETIPLSVDESSGGAAIIYQGQDISSEFSSGALGGLLDFQGGTLTDTRNDLDSMARELVALFNQTHQAGFDLDGNPGQALFSAVSGQESSTIKLEVSDARLVAAAGAAGAVGDGRNAQALADLRDEAVSGLGGQTLRDFYAQTLFDVGLATRSSRSNLALQQKVLAELEGQREGVSGVSLDEEAVNLMQYQRTYQASAKLIRVLDSLLEETLGLVK